jgi:type II secretory pathway component PulF
MKNKKWVIAGAIATILPIVSIGLMFLFSNAMGARADQWASEGKKLPPAELFALALGHFWRYWWWLLSFFIFAIAWSIAVIYLLIASKHEKNS